MERPIEATIILGAAYDAAAALLCGDPQSTIGASATLEATAALGATVRREVALAVGTARRDAELVSVPLCWNAEKHDDLFPSFAGTLVAEPSVGGTRLRLTGSYAVPCLLGRFGDGVRGRRVAQHAVARWLEDVARRLDAVAGGTVSQAYEAHVHEPKLSELSIG
jgi:hypothetical protein